MFFRLPPTGCIWNLFAQAIDLLDNLIGMVEDNQENDYDTAFRMAIDALKAQLLQEGTTKDATSDLIDRQQALKALRKCQTYLYDARDPELKIELSSAEAAINNLPTIQPERAEGHWIEGGIYRDVIECYCSECGQLMTTAVTVRMNYCPNCGAKMKGERQK